MALQGYVWPMEHGLDHQASLAPVTGLAFLRLRVVFLSPRVLDSVPLPHTFNTDHI
jgi:hypothetical protein